MQEKDPKLGITVPYPF